MPLAGHNPEGCTLHGAPDMMIHGTSFVYQSGPAVKPALPLSRQPACPVWGDSRP